MASVLELIEKTEPLMKFKDSDDVFIPASVKTLSEYRERLREFFYKNAEDKQGLNILFMQTNAAALQVEKHLSRVDEEYRVIYNDRREAAELYNKIEKLVKDIDFKDKALSDNEIVNVANIVRFVKMHNNKSQFYVWEVTENDRRKVKEAKSFLEVYNDGNIYS